MESNYKTKKYHVYFCELGQYEALEYDFDDYEEAVNKLKEFEDECKSKSFFGYVAEIKLCRSLEDGKERNTDKFL